MQEEYKTLAINQSKAYQEEGVQININDIKLAKASSVLNFETVSNYEDDQIDIKKPWMKKEINYFIMQTTRYFHRLKKKTAIIFLYVKI